MNPIKQIRLDHNLTQEALASLAGVTTQVVKKVEAGIYPSLPVNITKACVTLDAISSLDLVDSYENWILEELKSVKTPQVVKFASPAEFKDLRATICALNEEHSTIIAFCKLLKIHPFVIEKYEKGRMKEVPVQLVERLDYIKKWGLQNARGISVDGVRD